MKTDFNASRAQCLPLALLSGGVEGAVEKASGYIYKNVGRDLVHL